MSHLVPSSGFAAPYPALHVQLDGCVRGSVGVVSPVVLPSGQDTQGIFSVRPCCAYVPDSHCAHVSSPAWVVDCGGVETPPPQMQHSLVFCHAVHNIRVYSAFPPTKSLIRSQVAPSRSVQPPSEAEARRRDAVLEAIAAPTPNPALHTQPAAVVASTDTSLCPHVLHSVILG